MMNEIFNRSHLAHNINKSVSTTAAQFSKYVIEDLLNRLFLLSNDFKNILLIGVKDEYLPKQLAQYLPVAKITITTVRTELKLPEQFKCYYIDEEQITFETFETQTFDLIIYICGLHFLNRPLNFLSLLSKIITPNGIILTNFIGGNSLQNLRLYMLSLEEQFSNGTYTPHIIPFIRFDDVPTLLKKAGFNEVIVDYEDITLQYSSILALMREIKRLGYANILNKRGNYAISKKILNAINQERNIFKDRIKLITFTAALDRNTILTMNKEKR